MDSTLIVILIVTQGLVLYWLFYGKKKFERTLQDSKGRK